MTGFVVGVLLGAATAGAVAYGLWWRWRCPDPEAHQSDDELTDADREAVAKEFAAHAVAVRRQVSDYADLLAGDDAELRERLRRFEGGEAA